jgi:methylmalonyl-CoA/ethylmalonyl-CoA epimerase
MKSKLVFHHLGIATKSIEKCAGTYSALGYHCTEIKDEPSQNVRICFLSKEGSPLLELVEPLSKDAPVFNIIKNSGTTPYHTCYEVENMQEALDELEDMGFRMLFEPLVSEVMDHGLFCYLFSAEIGLFELYQKA